MATAFLEGRLDELAALALAVQQFGKKHAVPGSIVDDLNLILEELFVNIVRHGHVAATHGQIAVEMHAAGRRVTATISDCGAPFDPTLYHRNHPKPSPAECVGGLGIHLVHELSQSVRYCYDGARNVTTIAVALPP
jgi:serine/threonine-protein kinase RsbW